MPKYPGISPYDNEKGTLGTAKKRWEKLYVKEIESDTVSGINATIENLATTAENSVSAAVSAKNDAVAAKTAAEAAQTAAETAAAGIQSVVETDVDNTLSIAGVAADAKVTGDWLRDIAKPVTLNTSLPETAYADEYMKVTTDSEGRVLYGVKRDGTFTWQKGVPQHVIKEFKPTIKNDEYLQITQDNQGKIVEAILKNGIKRHFSLVVFEDVSINGNLNIGFNATRDIAEAIKSVKTIEDYIPSSIKVKPGITFDLNYPYLVKRYSNQFSCYATNFRYQWMQAWNQFCRILPIDNNKSVTFKMVDGDCEIEKTMNINLVQNTGGEKRILAIGDSWTQTGYWMKHLDDIDDSISFFGTVNSGAGVPCEGYGGKYPKWFVTNESSPFVFNGTYNFSQYMSQHTNYNLTHVIILLGINDNENTEFKKYMQILVNGIKAYNNNLKVIVCTPPPRSLYPSWQRGIDSGAEQDKVAFNLTHVRECEELNNISELAYTHFVLHPFHDFPQGTRVFDSSTGAEEPYLTDPVHPTVAGYNRLANVIYSYIL